MATLSFYLRNDKNPTQVYAYFSVSRTLKFRNSTGYMVNPKIWKNGMPNKKYIDGAELYNILTDLEKFIYSKFNTAELHKNWLEETIREFKGESIKSKDTLIEYFERYIESAHKRKNYKGGVGLSKNRIKVLETSIKMIERFEKYQGKIWLLSEINKQQIEEFQKWQLNQGYSSGYSGMNLTNIKTVCKFADR